MKYKIAIVILVLSNFVFADETYHTNGNNNIIEAPVSKTEISRISLPEEVVSLHTIRGEIEFEIFNSDIFLTIQENKPINFFVRTISGKIYKFIVVPTHMPSTQIFVKHR